MKNNLDSQHGDLLERHHDELQIVDVLCSHLNVVLVRVGGRHRVRIGIA